jgi:hypothetical protein
MIALGLIMMMSVIGVIGGQHFWNSYRLDRNAKALSQYLNQIEAYGIMTQSDLKILFTKENHNMRIRVEGSLKKGLKTLELQGVDKIEPNRSSIYWIYSSPYTDYTITLISKGQRREIHWRSHIVLDDQEAV